MPLPPLRDALTIAQPAVPGRPFTVIGERGAILGYQNGEFEAWLFPVKILNHFRISAELTGYPVPIDMNAQASSIRVSPSETVITYSHAACTVRQYAISPRSADPWASAIVLFEIDSVRPVELTMRFSPAVERMWPAPNYGPPNAEWVERDSGGYYLLHTNNAALAAAVAMPGARPGVMAPYQERPRTLPVEFRLSYDPQKDRGKLFPLLLATGKETDNLLGRLAAINDSIPALWSQTRDYYRTFLDRSLDIETPDEDLNHALRWAEVAVEQGRVRFHDETGLTAGFAPSGDSARPGFGWFFGRDTLWSLYAIHAYGDFELARQALEFLIHRQRSDGKIMHEYSQSADLVDWAATPYFYAAADSAPLFVMAMEDYVRASGDLEFLHRHWDSVKRAYAFTRAHDSDGDGIFDNSEGTGWVESWPGKMPHQEFYLAALDRQSAGAMSRLAAIEGELDLADAARKSCEHVGSVISRYYDATTGFYAFSRNPDGSLDRAATIYPSVAWWDGRFTLAGSGGMLERWASHEFSTDWGTRDVSKREWFYDPISYHQGSVWPLFTAWVAGAEYRAGQPLSGYAHLRQNLGLTYSQDLGAVTELLSGDLFEPLGRSSSHQTWSSSTTYAVAVHGLFGLDWNATAKTLRVAPQFPPAWQHASLRHLHVGNATFDLAFDRQGGQFTVRATSDKPEVLCLKGAGEDIDAPCPAPPAGSHELRWRLPAVEVGIDPALPQPGARTAQLKVLSLVEKPSGATLRLEAQGGATEELPVRFNRPGVTVRGAEVDGTRLRVKFPPGENYQSALVEFSW
jgi:hypothetical protein